MTATNNEPTWVVAAVLHREGEILILRRGPEQSGAGFWEFPGGKVEVGESPQQALRREIQEELGIAIQVGASLGEVIHDYVTKRIRLCVYWAEPLGTDLVLTDHDAYEWVLPENLDVQKLSAADRPFVERIQKGISRL